MKSFSEGYFEWIPIEAIFKQWKMKFDKPLLAKSKCGDGDIKTLDEVYKSCNTQDPFQIPKCRIPVSFQCGSSTVNSIVDLNSLGSSNQFTLAIAPPVDMPFVSVLMDLPGVPTYELFRNIEVHNDTFAMVALTSMMYHIGSMSHPMNFAGDIDLERCAGGNFTIGGDCEACDYELVSAKSMQPVMGIATNPDALPCDLDDVLMFREYLNSTIYKIQTANSQAEFSKGINTLNLVINMDGFVGCEASVSSMVTSWQITAQVSGVRGCYLDYTSPEFFTDPCCNTELQFSQCCAARTASMNVTLLQAINYTAINSSVPAGPGDAWTREAGYVPGPTRTLMLNNALNALSEFVQAEHANDDPQNGCQPTLQRTIPLDFLGKSTAFLDECNRIIQGGMTKSGTANAKCSTDTDSYTACDKRSYQCAYPTSQNTLQAYVACVLDKSPPDVLLYVRHTLAVPSSPADTLPQRLAARLSDFVTDMSCDGPEQYSIGACLLSTASASCEELAAIFPQTDSQFPEMTLVDQNMEGVNSENVTVDEPSLSPGPSSDPISYQWIFVRKDRKTRAACVNASLRWVNVSFGGTRRFSVCRVPQWSAGAGGSEPGSPDYSSLPNAKLHSRRSAAGTRSQRSPDWVRKHFAVPRRARSKRSTTQAAKTGAAHGGLRSQSIRSENSTMPLDFCTRCGWNAPS